MNDFAFFWDAKEKDEDNKETKSKKKSTTEAETKKSVDIYIDNNGRYYQLDKDGETVWIDKDEEKVIVSDIEKEDYKRSITHYKRINGNDDYTLLEAELKTGRTHQLRAQLSHIGHTIVGDTKYGKNIKEETMYLFSYYLKIDLYDLELEMGIPNFFLKKCDVQK